MGIHKVGADLTLCVMMALRDFSLVMRWLETDLTVVNWLLMLVWHVLVDHFMSVLDNSSSFVMLVAFAVIVLFIRRVRSGGRLRVVLSGVVTLVISATAVVLSGFVVVVPILCGSHLLLWGGCLLYWLRFLYLLGLGLGLLNNFLLLSTARLLLLFLLFAVLSSATLVTAVGSAVVTTLRVVRLVRVGVVVIAMATISTSSVLVMVSVRVAITVAALVAVVALVIT